MSLAYRRRKKALSRVRLGTTVGAGRPEERPAALARCLVYGLAARKQRARLAKRKMRAYRARVRRGAPAPRDRAAPTKPGPEVVEPQFFERVARGIGRIFGRGKGVAS